MPSSPRPVINAKDTRRFYGHVRGAADILNQGVAADWHRQQPEKTPALFGADRESDGQLLPAKPLGAPGPLMEETGKWLREGPSPALPIATEEVAYSEMQSYPEPEARQVMRMTLIVRMRLATRAVAGGTDGIRCVASGKDLNAISVHLDALNDKLCGRGEEHVEHLLVTLHQGMRPDYALSRY